MPTRRLAVLAPLLGLALILPLAAPVAAQAADQSATDDRGTLRRHAADTWRSFELLLDPGTGLLRGGFWVDPPGSECTIPGNYRDPTGPPVLYTCHHYGSLNTEPRIASYLGIAFGQVSASHYFRMARTFPPTCDWGWQEQQPAGVTRTYLGVEVFEGHYRYRGIDIVPSWGGSMFEALMVPLLIPEARWGPRSWGVNHPLYVRAQIEHGLDEAGYGYWGFSPSNNPSGGYR